MDERSPHVTEKIAESTAVEFDRVSLMGLMIAAVQIPKVIELMIKWIEKKDRTRYLILGGMHGFMEAHGSNEIRRAFASADMILPDGMPLVWFSRLQGKRFMKRRVYGPELMRQFCLETGSKYRHYLYGGNTGVAAALANQLKKEFATNVVGLMTPPFHTLSDDELRRDAAVIQSTKPDVLWIGISTPKQDLLMQRLQPLLTNSCVVLGVGAAFDFNAGQKPAAPVWMQEHGLEWAFRLMSEPRRLWRRYLILGPKFIWFASGDYLSQLYRRKQETLK